MNTVLQSRQRGFAIADALIAFGVMVIAGVALLSLQGDLMNGSRSSKAQAEAMMIARDHMEMWRNYVAEDQYLAGPSPSKPISPNKIKGVNAEFMVRYLNQPAPADEAKLLTVRVCWECDVDADGVLIEDSEKSVSLETMLYYTKPEIASAIGEQHDSSDSDPPTIPSPWITGEEGPHPTTVPLTQEADSSNLLATITDTHRVMILEDDDSGGTKIGFENQPVNLIYYVDPDSGRSNVEVVHGERDGEPWVRLTSFGGGVNKIQGEIILHPGAKTSLTDVGNHLQLLASPPSYCVFPICEDTDFSDKACEKELIDGSGRVATYVSYVCYVPADCTDGGEGCDETGTGEVDADRDTEIGFKPPPDKDLNGGWYGRVGNFNIFLDRANDVVCVADTVRSSNLTPSREYVSYRCPVSLEGGECPSDNISGNEGVNRSFDCQTFIIATQNDVANNDDTACSELASSNYGINLPPENIIRNLGVSDLNTVLPMNTDYCSL